MMLEKLLPEKYSHTVCKFDATGGTNFKAAIKLKLSSEEEAKKWLEDFHRSSGFTWRTSKTYPNSGRYNKYRADFSCRTIKKDTSCPATLFLILKRRPESGERKSRSGDPHMKEGLFFHINLRNEHNHLASCDQAMIRRHVSGETIEKLKHLFQSGHSPSSALKILKLKSQESGESNYGFTAAHDSVCPDLSFCYRLYYKMFKKSYDSETGEEIFKDLEQTLENYNKEQGDVCARMCKTSDNQLAIAICTPMMKRTHGRLRESSEMMFVDSSWNCGRLNHHLFLLLTHSSAGSLPLGVFITTSESQETISAAIELLQTVFPSDRFFGHPDGPLVIMTDDCTPLRQALHGAFPEATLVLCVFHLLQAMWRWLWNCSSEVPMQHRAQLLKSFRGLVYASTPTDLMEGYNRLIEDHVASQHPDFVRHLQEVFQRREEWAICLQTTLPIRENDIDSYIDSAMRMVKEKVLHRLKSYNVTQLVNFVVTRMEAHYIHRLIDVANNRLQTSLKKGFKVKDMRRYSIVQEDQDNYTVTNSSNAALSYRVDMSLACCTCPAGILGGHCKHQSAVAKMFGHSDGLPQGLVPDTRKLFYQIATGEEEIPDKGSRLVPKKRCVSERAVEVCTGEIYCCPDTGGTEADCLLEPVESTVIETQPSTSVETDSGEQHLKERLSSMFLDITKKLDNPDFTHSIVSFVKTYENLQSDSAMASALSSFGQSIQTKARSCKRQRDYLGTSAQIGVRLTAVSRGRTSVDGERILSGERPTKMSRNEHVIEGTIHSPFLSIAQCVEESMCLEETH